MITIAIRRLFFPHITTVWCFRRPIFGSVYPAGDHRGAAESPGNNGLFPEGCNFFQLLLNQYQENE
jgi:hypothetical protein